MVLAVAAPPCTNNVVHAQQAPTLPRPIGTLQKPVYPDAALKDAVVGRVEVQVTVSPKGLPTKSEITYVAPTGYGFEKAVKTAVESWRFDPALVDGVPAAGTYTQSFDFSPGGFVPITRWTPSAALPFERVPTGH
jgi:TonB family protein